jgi:hypothetical protein
MTPRPFLSNKRDRRQGSVYAHEMERLQKCRVEKKYGKVGLYLGG